MKVEIDKKELAEQWSFSWPVMNVLIGGFSSIDLPESFVKTRDEAKEFLLNYGYDPDSPQDARFMHAAVVEALHFIERHLMPVEWGKGMQPPDAVMSCADVRDLLVWASDRRPEFEQRRMWSCAILRVLHTIAHIEGAFSYASIDAARDEIWRRFQRIVFSDENGKLWIGDQHTKIELERIDWKPEKSRESIVMKLLHKRANVAEHIYDMLGIRLVLRRFCDVIPCVKLLYQMNVISFPNAIPTRARNTLVDINVFKLEVDNLRGELLTGVRTPQDFLRKIDQLDIPPPEDGSINPHSGNEYGAIQMTCRQLVRTPGTVARFRERLMKTAEADPNCKEICKTVEEFFDRLGDMTDISPAEEAAFFPYELQITDARTYQRNMSGKASHVRYKKSQLRAARRRILHEIVVS